MSNGAHSVTQWLLQLDDAEQAALNGLFRRVGPDLVQMVRLRLHLPVRLADADDLATEVFVAFMLRWKAGKALDLSNRKQFFALLACIVDCRVKNLVKMANRKERRVANEAAMDGPGEDGAPRRSLERAPDRARNPDELVAMEDVAERYVAKLPEELQPFAQAYLDDELQKATAERLGCSERQVQRNMNLIRKIWQDMAAKDFDAALA